MGADQHGAAVLTTIARILAAIRDAYPDPVTVRCHPDDVERASLAFELLPSVRVAGCDLVPPGRFWIAGRPCTEEER